MTGSPFLPEAGAGGPFFSPFARQPMFMGGGAPLYTGPFNMNMGGGSFGQILNAFAPMALSAFMGGTGHSPFQMFPQQNLYDQIRANQFYLQRQQAAAMAATRDQNQMLSTMNGFNRFMTGRNLTAAEMARNNRFAGTLSQWMPLLTQVMGPDLIDQLHGSRGSAAVMAANLHEALRTSIDPVTGRQGPSGASIGAMSQEIFERLYGPGADPNALAGLSAGQAGQLANELQGRGLLGTPLGSLSMRNRLRMPGAEYRRVQGDIQRLRDQGHQVPLAMLEAVQRAERSFIDDGAVARAAESYQAAQAAKGNNISFDNARRAVSRTRDRLLTEPDGIGLRELENLPGGADIIRAMDGGRAATAIRNMSGVVKAMKDIFGDMGHPNAPMRELINGLEALTQGGMATMSPDRLEMMVRRTHAIAQQTGIGIPGMMGLTTQAAGFADRFGVERVFAVQAAQDAALFGRAAGNTQRLDLAGWGRPDMERITLTNNQLRVAAAASPAINQINALLRMQASGMIPTQGDTELRRIMVAIGRGEATYAGGDLLLSPGRLLGILSRDAGINPQVAQTILADRFGNREFGALANTQALGIELQQMDRERFASNAVGFGIGGVLRDALGGGAVAGASRDVLAGVFRGVATDFLGFSPEVMADNVARQAAFEGSIRSNLRTQVESRMPGAGAGQVDAEVERIVGRLGPNGLAGLATAAWSNINQRASTVAAYGNGQGLWSQGYRPTVDAAIAGSREANVTAVMQEALRGFGSASPIARLVDAFAAAGPGTGLRDILAHGLGGINLQEIADRDPTGLAADILRVQGRNERLNPRDAGDYEKMMRNARIVRGLALGNAAAAQSIDELEAGSQVIDPRNATAAERDIARLRTRRWLERRRVLGPMTDAQIDEVAGRNGLVRRLEGVADADLRGLYDAMWNGGGATRLPRSLPESVRPAGPGGIIRALTQGPVDLLGMVMPELVGQLGRMTRAGGAAGAPVRIQVTGSARLTAEGNLLLDLLGQGGAVWNNVRDAIGG